ncbi:hypothetical protein [Shewanella acanthi]|uniref:hypothetical protein n=1 Tax=Shewanella acanthi TaxID=2864212 RepID=UPI001C65DD84|nr:hypothetical protein [Shewanella acanthi]QYJ77910.1 hypothetical protein K0H61_12365 [Shewanella acanthi]
MAEPKLLFLNPPAIVMRLDSYKEILGEYHWTMFGLHNVLRRAETKNIASAL